MAFSAFNLVAMLYNLHHYLVLEHSITPKGHPVPIVSHSLFPLPQPLAATNLPSVWGVACSGHFASVESHTVWPSCLASLAELVPKGRSFL